MDDGEVVEAGMARILGRPPVVRVVAVALPARCDAGNRAAEAHGVANADIEGEIGVRYEAVVVELPEIENIRARQRGIQHGWRRPAGDHFHRVDRWSPSCCI